MKQAVITTLESWITQVAESGSFTPQEHKEEYLLITEFLCHSEEDSFSKALRTCRDYSLKESMDPNVLKELINATLNQLIK
jgi:hypothetical protein